MGHHSKYQLLLQDLGKELIEEWKSLEELRLAETQPDHLFYSGVFHAYRRVFKTLVEQAQLFDIPLVELGLPENFNPEKPIDVDSKSE